MAIKNALMQVGSEELDTFLNDLSFNIITVQGLHGGIDENGDSTYYAFCIWNEPDEVPDWSTGPAIPDEVAAKLLDLDALEDETPNEETPEA